MIGGDTATRVADPRFYGGSTAALRRALGDLRDLGVRFLVAVRRHQGRLISLSDVPIPSGCEDLFEELPEEAFRLDVSSTEIRKEWS